MKVLIAGGAGYIGSTVASACLDAGITPVIVDSLVTGRVEFTAGRAFYQGDIADGPLIDRIFAEHPDIDAVVHAAALIVVPDSVMDPVGYYRANVAKSLEFAAHLLRHGCGRLVFSSSAAIYRAGDDLTVDEDSLVDPQSPYARTKAVCEAMFADIAATQPIRVLSLRYFNPIGADPTMRTGLQLPKPTHALGQMIRAHEEGIPFVITGTDWPTRDGTGLRDYVHVWDLAAAHVAALTRFDTLPGSTAINLGTGTGTTVRELLAAFNQVAGRPVQVREAGRRPGDVAGACSGNDRAKRLLGWQPRYDITEGIRHSLQWAARRDEVLSVARPARDRPGRDAGPGQLPGTARQFARFAPLGQARAPSGPLGVVETLEKDRAENAPAIPHRIQVAEAVDPRILVTPDLHDVQARHGDADVNQRLDFEPIAPQAGAVGRSRGFGVQAEHADVAAPEDVVPVAQIRIPRTAQDIHQPAEHPVTGTAQPGDVVAAAALGEPGALGEIRPVQQLPDELRDLARIGRAVRVHHRDDIAGRHGKPAGQSVTLTGAGLRDDPDIGTQPTGGGDRVVYRTAIHDDDLVERRRQLRKNMRQVTRFVKRRNDHADFRPRNLSNSTGRCGPVSRLPEIKFRSRQLRIVNLGIQ